MADKTQSYVNKNVEKINFELEKISRTLNNTTPILKKTNKNLSNVNKIFGEYKNALDFFDKAHDEIDMDNCLSGIKKFSDAFKNISDELNNIFDLIDDIKNNFDDINNFKLGWKNLKNSLEYLSEDYENLVELCDNLKHDFNKTKEKMVNKEFDNKKDLILVLNNSIDLFEMIKNGFRNLKVDSKNLAGNLIAFGNYFDSLDRKKIKDDFDDIKKNMRDMNDNFLKVNDGLNNFYVAMEVTYQKMGRYMVSRDSDGKKFISLRPDLTVHVSENKQWIIDTKRKLPGRFAKESDVLQRNTYSMSIRDVKK